MANDSRRRSTPRRPRKPEKRKRRWLGRVLGWGVALVVLAAVGLFLAVAFTARSLPSYAALRASEHAQMIVVRARDGTEIVQLGPSYGEWLNSREIPQVMKGAMIAVEDRRFYSHYGVDPVGVLRSLWVRAREGRWRQGGSTITQQLARNIFLNNNRTFERKAREAILALALERKFTKEEILELYLNKVYFGGGAYGIDSASRLFFSHPATELSTPEAAIIAGLVKAPSQYSPTADAEAAVSRASIVLRLMAQEGVISPYEARNVDPETVRLKKDHGQNSVRYFTDWALPQLDMLLPNTFEPIEVWTTLDPGLQDAATAAIRNNAPSGAQGALVSMDRDGAVLALVGGADYVKSNYNRATQAVRQPGSAWKLFVYLAALEAGYTPDSAVIDKPVTIEGWTPRNSGGRYAGQIDLRSAFAYSKNTVAAQLGEEVGFGTVASMARRFGITTPVSTFPSMVLGASETRLIDMTRAFAAVSAQGRSVTPYGITKVTGADGSLLYRRQPEREQMLVAPYVAAAMTDLLQTAVSTGTGRAAQIGRPVAGKTGTTSSNKDGWFLGFSSGITTGVWMGRDDAKAVRGLQGGAAPARAFADFMRRAVAKRPVEQFQTELQLPEWQLEPDDETWFGNPDDYYFMDEDGNPVDPVRGDGWGRYEQGYGPGSGDDYDEDYRYRGNEPEEPRVVRPRDDYRGRNRAEPDRAPSAPPPPAANEDFLNRAIGRGDGGAPGTQGAPPSGTAAAPPRSRPMPAPTPVPTRIPVSPQSP
ncbi:transglycosylase domain-containing protein [Croceicoccus hydrothermalis]|uniref:transglycosylase domain-containing protein n=1 Tax=Croceicoccus hydrothermalis TaxID=2867964 RepID=UPI001EFBFB0D|nr:PBP1A family penicillin-binding protein [Croceicoccus hydrothermalis]